MPAPSLETMCWRPREIQQDFRGLFCEIASDLCPNPLSHDWHVQPSCQRPKHDPPERRAFSPAKRPLSSYARPDRIRDPVPHGQFRCPRNLSNIPRSASCVNASSPQNFHQISTTGSQARGQRKRAAVWSSAWECRTGFDSRLFGHAQAEDRKLRKELAFGGPCLEGTLQKPGFF